MFSNQRQLFDTLKDSLQIALLQRHRVLLVLTGDTKRLIPALCDEFNQWQLDHVGDSIQMLSDNVKSHTTNIMHVPDVHSNSDVADQINLLLGSENRCVVFDALCAFDERLFAASAGTIVAGGLLILQTSELTQWRDKSRFHQRFASRIVEHQSHAIPYQQHPQNGTAIFIGNTIGEHCNAYPLPTYSPTPNPKPALAWQIEQAQLVSRLSTQIQNPAPSVSVVQGDRGRGKSALIGLAFQQFINRDNNTHRKICITAHRRSACQVLMRHAEYPIEFLPIGKALNGSHDILIVEEAGSIPLAILKKLLLSSHTLVFATTVQGYEGAGRGFAIRFAKTLDTLRPHWIKLRPVQPVRWSPGDPLEAFVNDALLLETSISAITPTQSLVTAEEAVVRLIDQQQLADDDALLESIYGLLVQAHYQTTPADLRNMLDQPQLLVFAQYSDDVLIGAALVAMEGAISADLDTAIVQKQRRLPDQLLPQLLAQTVGNSGALSATFARIVRIAIHPAIQRRGYGTQLCRKLAQQLQSSAASLGTSFGADEHTLNFWLKLGLTPIHYGYKANPRSGLRSACLIKSTDPLIATIVEQAAGMLYRNAAALQTGAERPDPIAEQLLASIATPTKAPSDSQRRQLIHDFCLGHRSFIDTAGLILADESIASIGRVAAQLKLMQSHYAQWAPKIRRTHEAQLRQLLLEQVSFE